MENQDIQQLDQLERPDGAYDENQIQVLEGLEAVRKRPGMYIGSTDERGLHHLVYEIVDNAVDEALAGFCNEIIITLHKDGSCSVQDNGRGFPVGIHPKIGRPAVEVCLTILHAGGKFGGGGYKVSGGLHGVGASVVNALSKHMQVNVYQDGKIYQQEYARGKVLYDLKVIGETERTGTTIRFWPDVKNDDDPNGIFETGDFQYDVLKTRFREMAFLNRGIRIVFRDERPEEPKENVFHYEGGISEFVKFINKNKEVLFAEPIYISGLVGTTSVEVAMQYNDTYSENIFAFVNNIHTPDGGTHLAGFNMALTRVINDYGRKHNILIGKRTAEELKIGIACLVPRAEVGIQEVKGRCLTTGLPKSVKISSVELVEAIAEPARDILETIHMVLERTPPELVADLAQNGIIMAGGGSLIYGFDQLVEKDTGIRTTVVDDALSCAAFGSGKMLMNLNDMQDGMVNLARKRQMKA